MDDKTWMLWLFIGSSVLITALAMPLILRKIKPNYLYGFRVPKTLNDEEIWYAANAYAGWYILWTGIALLVSAIVFYLLPQVGFLAYSLILLGVTVTALTVTLVQSFRYLQTL